MYAVGIPTRDRPDMLEKCVEAFSRQTIKPSLIIICNNNTGRAKINLVCKSIPIKIIKNKFNILGPEQAHQTNFEEMLRNDFQIGVRWDDDLIPDFRCMEVMLSHYANNFFQGAVGGCYPKPDSPIWEEGYNPEGSSPLGGKTHIQFFKWGEKYNNKSVHVLTLYSGFMYDINKVKEVGGFCTEYSQLGYRGEADLCLRIGNCVIDPKATATHFCSTGGVRTINKQDYFNMERKDHQLFKKRMLSLEIKPKIL